MYRRAVQHGGKLPSEIVGILDAGVQPLASRRRVQEAGITLDRALFPLLVMVERLGPIGVVDLADRVGRDYTTVSRQVAKLDALGLVERRGGAGERRVREATITPKGKAMSELVDEARERIAKRIFAKWPQRDVEDLARLMRKFADDIQDDTPNHPPTE